MAQFERYVGIDYSGAVTPESGCKGLRVYAAEGCGSPEPVPPPPDPRRRYWTMRRLAEWLCDKLADDIPTIAYRVRKNAVADAFVSLRPLQNLYRLTPPLLRAAVSNGK